MAWSDFMRSAALVRTLQALAFTLLMPMAEAEAEEFSPSELRPFSRTTSRKPPGQFSAEQWQWLSSRQMLRLGVVESRFGAPLDILVNDHDYEGITADYAELLASNMGLRLSVQGFPSHAAALAALGAGQIDLVGSTRAADLGPHDGYALTHAYLPGGLATVTPLAKPLAQQAGARAPRIAIAGNTELRDELLRRYPNADIRPYPSSRQGLDALRSGHADMFVGDAVRLEHLVDQNHCGSLRIQERRPSAERAVGFAVRQNDDVLLDLVNQLLAALPEADKAAILDCWSVSAIMQPPPAPLNLTARERRWIEKKKSIKVATTDISVPLAFFDEHGDANGITHEFLGIIAQRTGLHIQPVRSSSTSDLGEQLAKGEIDAIGALEISEENRDRFALTRPYLADDQLIVVKRNDAASYGGLESFHGKRLAVSSGSTIAQWLRVRHPAIKIMPVDNEVKALEAVNHGSADGAVQTELGASHSLAHGFGKTLQVGGVMDADPARIGLAVQRGDAELLSILNKALLSINPKESNAVVHHWKSTQGIRVSAPNGQREKVNHILGAAAVLGTLLMGWNGYLRRQIGKRKRAERALSDQLEFMRALINGTPYPIYVRDSRGRLLACNQRYLNELSAAREQVMGKTLEEADVVPTDVARQFHAIYADALNEGRAIFADRDGMVHGVEKRIYHWVLPYNDSIGGAVGTIGGWIDVSDRARLLKELQAAKDLAESANRAKSDFLVTASHEIRTPMNAIAGMLELALKEKADSGAQRDYVNIAYNSTQALLALVSDLLDLEKIESDKLELLPERASLRQLAESVIQVFDGVARNKGVALRLAISPHLHGDVLIDPTRFKQILSNLASNAIKFTDEGQVTVHLDAHPIGADRLGVQLRVADTGIGISLEDQQRLFVPFAQARHGARAIGGTGMGLCITRKLAELMGGSISLQSEPGKGSEVRFDFDVPLLSVHTPADAATAAEPERRAALQVLVVDDNAPSRLLLHKQMEHLGHAVVQASGGNDAWRAWRPGAYDLVVTDCNMAAGDGYTLARRIRAAEAAARDAGRCTIWACTADARLEQIQSCREAGMDDCLFKPVGLDILRQRLKSGMPQTNVLNPAWREGLRFDPMSIDNLAGGDAALVNRFLAELLLSNEQDGQRLRAAVDQVDPGAIRDAAHSIVGIARMIDAAVLIHACVSLEQKLDMAAPPAAVNEATQAVLDQLAALTMSVRAWLDTGRT